MSNGASEQFGKDLGLMHEVIVTGRKVGAGRDFWAALAHNEEMFKKVVDLVNPRPSFKVLVDYTKPLKEMIVAGKYDWVNGDITQERFPIKGTGQKEVEVTLFHFNKTITSDQVISEMDKAGYRPARLEELLALGVSQPELQKQFPVVAVGSVWRRNPGGHRNVPYLHWFSAERCLGLYWFEGGWGGHWRFAAVCK